MKRFLSVLLGMALLMTMALALAGCNKNTDVPEKTGSAAAVTTQSVEKKQQTEKTADNAKKETVNTNAKVSQFTQKDDQKTVQNTSLKASQNTAQKTTQTTAQNKTQTTAQPKTTAQNKTQTTAQPKASAQPATPTAEQNKAQTVEQKTEQPAEQGADQNTVQATTQSVKSLEKAEPVQSLEGTYACDRCTIEVKKTVADTIVFHVYWSSSAWENSEWIMTGNLNEEGNVVSYGDCMRRNNTYDENGSVISCDLVYYGGKGSVTFKDNTLIWEDQAENVASGMTFTKVA